jgi:hypothetical protein
MQTRNLCAGRGARESADHYSASLIKGLGKLGKRCKGVRGCAAAAVAVCTVVALYMHGPQGTCRGCNHLPPSPPHSITWQIDMKVGPYESTFHVLSGHVH